MDAKKTLDQRFLDAEIDELLQAAGFDPQDLVVRGTNAVERVLVVMQQVKTASATLDSLPVLRQREIASRLGIRRSVLAALSERRALVDTIPKRFLGKLAAEVETSLDAMRFALMRPVLAHVSQHKSDRAPEPPKQVAFQQLLRDAAMTDDEIAELTRDDA